MAKKFTKNDFRRALRKVRTKLLNGKITKEQFDMDTPLHVGGSPKFPMCDTFGCIGGHMAIELEPKVLQGHGSASDFMLDAQEAQENLHALFYGYPMHDDFKPSRVTRRQAAAAITRALDGAEDPWKARRR